MSRTKLSLLLLFFMFLIPSTASQSYVPADMRDLPKGAPWFPLNALDFVALPDTRHLLRAEGCTDGIVVPPAPSGPTISCGIDLGNIGRANIKLIFSGLVPDSVLVTLLTASGKRGAVARQWADQHSNILLAPGVSDYAFRRAVALIWSRVYQNRLVRSPPEVQSALLSYAYHTGRAPQSLSKLESMSPRAVAGLLLARGDSYTGSNRRSFCRRRASEAKMISNSCCNDVAIVGVRDIVCSIRLSET